MLNRGSTARRLPQSHQPRGSPASSFTDRFPPPPSFLQPSNHYFFLRAAHIIVLLYLTLPLPAGLPSIQLIPRFQT